MIEKALAGAKLIFPSFVTTVENNLGDINGSPNSKAIQLSMEIRKSLKLVHQWGHYVIVQGFAWMVDKTLCCCSSNDEVP